MIGVLDGQNPHAKLTSEQFEVVAVRRNHGRPMPSRGQRDQRVVLEVSALAAIPIVCVADGSNEAARRPPVVLIRSPRITGQGVDLATVRSAARVPALRRSSDSTTAE